MINCINQSLCVHVLWTDLGWFIYMYQLEVQISFCSSAAWPPNFFYLSFSTLYLYLLMENWYHHLLLIKQAPPWPQISSPSLLSPPPPSNGIEINKPPGGLNRGFRVSRNHRNRHYNRQRKQCQFSVLGQKFT